MFFSLHKAGDVGTLPFLWRLFPGGIWMTPWHHAYGYLNVGDELSLLAGRCRREVIYMVCEHPNCSSFRYDWATTWGFVALVLTLPPI